METPHQSHKQRKRLFVSVLIVLAALLVWWVWVTWFPRSEPVNLPYSAFLEQIQAGNVRAVTITGSEIDGLFLHPVTGPVPVTGRTTNTDNLTFHTHLAEAASSPNLVSLLNGHHIQITARPSSRWWLAVRQLAVIPQEAPAGALIGLALLVGILGITSNRDSLLHGLKRLNPFHHHSPLPYTIEHPEETYASISGQESAVEALKTADKSSAVSSIMLLAGPAGTGKTLLAKAAAGEKAVPLISYPAVQMLAPSITPERLHHLFETVRQSAPCVLLIDRLETAGRAQPDIYQQFLTELDGMEASPGITILGETRYPGKIDPALLNPTRFSRMVFLNLPYRKEREAILGLYTRKLHLANNVNLGVIARTTTGFSGAELAGLCAAAAQSAQKMGHSQLTMADFEDALDHLLIQSPHELLNNDQVRRAAAYHEAGHALVAWLLPNADPLKRISILSFSGMAASDSAGALTRLQSDFSTADSDQAQPIDLTGSIYSNGNLASREDILARLSVVLGGRAAEEIATGDVTISAESDLVEATRLARRMITRWGMGSLGLMALGPDTGMGASLRSSSREISEETASQIDRDVQALLSTRYESVRKLLENARGPLEQLVRALLADETLDQEEISRILGPRTFTTADETNALSTAS